MKRYDVNGVLLAPVDETARKVVGKGERYQPCNNGGQNIFTELPKLTTTNTVDLRGAKYGRFTVLGLVKKQRGGWRGTWACRCSCGNIEGRSARAIRRAIDPDACCHECASVKHAIKIRNLIEAGKLDRSFLWKK